MGNKLHGMAETDLNEKIQAVLDGKEKMVVYRASGTEVLYMR